MNAIKRSAPKDVIELIERIKKIRLRTMTNDRIRLEVEGL